MILPLQSLPKPAISLVLGVLVHGWQLPKSLAALMAQQPAWNASGWVTLLSSAWSAVLELQTWNFRPQSLLGARALDVEPIEPIHGPLH